MLRLLPIAIRKILQQIEQRQKVEQILPEAQAQEKRSTFLFEASRLLASSLDYHTTLKSVASLAVPTFADWCFIDIVENNSTKFNEPIVAAFDPQKEALVKELRRRYPPPVDADFGAPQVLRTREPILASEIPESLVLSVAQDAEHLRLLRQLNAQSYMMVPLIARDRDSWHHRLFIGTTRAEVSKSRLRYGD